MKLLRVRLRAQPTRSESEPCLAKGASDSPAQPFVRRYRCANEESDLYGTFHEDSQSWTGMIGRLHQNEVDVAVTAVYVQVTRAQAADFLFPLHRRRTYLFYRKPSSDDASAWQKYLREFTPRVWFITGFLFLVFILELFWICRKNPIEKKCDIMTAILTVTAAFSNMGSQIQLRSYSGRIFLTTLFVTTIVLNIHYTSFLTSYLTVETYSPPFTTLEGLLKSRYKFILQQGNSDLNNFQISTVSVHQRLWRERIEPYLHSFPKTIKEFFSLMKETNYATVGDVEYAEGHVRCVTFDKYPTDMMYYESWAVRKESPLKKILNYNLKILLESGILIHKASRTRVEKFKNHSCPSTEKSRAIEIRNIYFVLQLLFGGHLLALVFLGTEVLSYRCGKVFKRIMHH